MKVTRIEVGPMGTNCYLVQEDAGPAGFVIDPGAEGSQIAERCHAEGLKPRFIVNTHGHMDHIGGNAALKENFPEAELCIGRDDADQLRDPGENLSALFGVPQRSPEADRLLAEGDLLEAGAVTLQTLTTPGHTRGMICLLARDAEPPQMFCGDLVFRGGVGRTDFPGGSTRQLMDSIRHKVLTLPEDTVLWPGHGPETTVGHEKQNNPFISTI